MQYRRCPSSWKDPGGTQPEAGSNAEATLISWRDPEYRQMPVQCLQNQVLGQYYKS